jgi:hypothetical protein
MGSSTEHKFINFTLKKKNNHQQDKHLPKLEEITKRKFKQSRKKEKENRE